MPVRALILLLLAGPATAQDCPLGDPAPKKTTTPAGRSCLAWADVARLAPAPATGPSADAPQPAKRTRPLLVYVYDPADRKAKDAVHVERVWREWKVVVPARLFDRVRITVEQARREAALRGHAKNRMVLFVRPGIETVATAPVRASVKRLYAAMRKTVALDFATSVDAVWREWQAIQEKIQAVKAKMRGLNEMSRRIVRTRDRAERAKLAERQRELQQRYAAEERALRQAEDALSVLRQ